jgi:hypothetical protein
LNQVGKNKINSLIIINVYHEQELTADGEKQMYSSSV